MVIHTSSDPSSSLPDFIRIENQGKNKVRGEETGPWRKNSKTTILCSVFKVINHCQSWRKEKIITRKTQCQKDQQNKIKIIAMANGKQLFKLGSKQDKSISQRQKRQLFDAGRVPLSTTYLIETKIQHIYGKPSRLRKKDQPRSRTKNQ